MINLFSTLVEFSTPHFPLDLLADQIASPGYAHFPDIMPASAIAELTGIIEEKEAADALHLAGVGVQAVLYGIVELAGEIGLGTVGEVAAICQAHTQYGIAGAAQRQVHG